ncbi:MAG: hypothetical protein CMN30_07665 [Sandaracinus sp.]|nr:hypothetical protein [Sandaracinus sp.]
MLRPRFALLLPLLLLSLAGCGDDDGGGGDDGDGDGTTADLGTTPTPAERSTPAAYVRGDHPRLIIELDVAPGLAPRAGVADLVTGALGEILDKPGGITVSADDTLSEDQMKDIWTADDLQTLAVATFDQVGADDAAVFQTLWLSGRYEADGVLAVAWANRYIAIFPETIESACGALLPTIQERICREAEGVWMRLGSRRHPGHGLNVGGEVASA